MDYCYQLFICIVFDLPHSYIAVFDIQSISIAANNILLCEDTQYIGVMSWAENETALLQIFGQWTNLAKARAVCIFLTLPQDSDGQQNTVI